MFGINDYKKALDKVYKKVVGKEYRNQMIKQNNDALHAALVNADKDQSGFEFYSTSNDAYNYRYKEFMNSLRSVNKERFDFSSNNIYLLAKTLFLSILSGVISVGFGAITILISKKKGFTDDLFLSSFLSALFACISIFILFAAKKEHKEKIKNINEADYEKNHISTFFRKYKSALGLQKTLLFFTDQTSDSKSMNRVEEVEYGAIQKVFLTDQDEKIEFTQKYVTGSSLPVKTIVETDAYKNAKVKTLNLLMPDNTIFSIIGPTGPNGETIEDLRDIIESKMCGMPLMNVNDYTYSDDNTIKV